MGDKNNKIEKIEKIINLVLASAYVKNQEPLSLILLAPAGQSKTHFLLQKCTKYSHISSDLSFAGLIKILKMKPIKKHIIIPDFIKITQKKKSTSENLLGILNNFLEEGVYSINLGNIETLDFKGRKGGIITATTKSSYAQNKKNWIGMGFQDRLIVVSYQYSSETIKKIQAILNNENHKKIKPKLLKLKSRVIETEPRLNSLFNIPSGDNLRRLRQLQNLAKCNALVNNRSKVIEEDIYQILDLLEIINTDFTTI